MVWVEGSIRNNDFRNVLNDSRILQKNTKITLLDLTISLV
jgi:hypothetical protein